MGDLPRFTDQPRGELQAAAQHFGFKRPRKPKAPRRSPAEKRLENVFSAFEQLLGPVGADGTSRAGALLGQVSREELGLMEELAPRFQELQQELQERAIEADPLAAASRQLALTGVGAIQAGLEGLGEDGLPDDIRRTITEEVRASGAARGLLRSPASALEEVSRLMGGREAIRASRLDQARAFLTGGAAAPGMALANLPGLRSFSPFNLAQPQGALTSAIPTILQGANMMMAQEGQQEMAGISALGGGIGGLIGTIPAWVTAFK